MAALTLKRSAAAAWDHPWSGHLNRLKRFKCEAAHIPLLLIIAECTRSRPVDP
jgi:hypothetical protein